MPRAGWKLSSLIGEKISDGRAAAFGDVRALSPWSRANLVPTFTETRVDSSRFYDGEDWAALCRARDAADPQRVFLANHGL